MKTHFRDFSSIRSAAEFAHRRSNLGHNVRIYGTSEVNDASMFRVYFSPGPPDINDAIEARVLKDKKAKR